LCAAARRRRRQQRRRRRSRGLIDGLVCQCGGALLPARDVEGEGGRRRDRASRPSRPLPTRPRCARRSVGTAVVLPTRRPRRPRRQLVVGVRYKTPADDAPPRHQHVSSRRRSGPVVVRHVPPGAPAIVPGESPSLVRRRPSVCLRSRRRRPRPPRTFIHIPMRPRHSICGASRAPSPRAT